MQLQRGMREREREMNQFITGVTTESSINENISKILPRHVGLPYLVRQLLWQLQADTRHIWSTRRRSLLLVVPIPCGLINFLHI